MPEGIEVAKKLISWADIMVESFAPGTMVNRGLGYDDVIKVKPDIIMISSSGQGQTGPSARIPIAGNWLVALSGFTWFSGWPDREPGYMAAYTDFIAPRYNIIAIMAALEYRRRTGSGQYLDMSQYEAGVQFMAPLVLDYVVNNRVLSRMGNKNDCAAPHNAYRCQGEDRWCAIAVFTDEEWESFCNVIGNPALKDDPRFITLKARKENEDDLDRLVEEWTINCSAEEVMNLMQQAGVPAGVVQNHQDLLDDPQMKYRGHFVVLTKDETCPLHLTGGF